MNMETTVEILGKAYQIKCPENEVTSLQKAAQFLEQQMSSMRDNKNMLSSDKIIVAAALNIAHQFIALENQTLRQAESIQQKLRELQHKLEKALLPAAHISQMELQTAE